MDHSGFHAIIDRNKQLTIRILQGTTLVWPSMRRDKFKQPIDLSEFQSGLLQVRATNDATADVLWERPVTIDGPAGTYTVTASAAETADLKWRSGFFHIELYGPQGAGHDPTRRVLAGRIEVSREIVVSA